MINSIINSLGIVWRELGKEIPEEEGFYVLAEFDDRGRLIRISEDYVKIESFCHGITYNGGPGPALNNPTHYMSRKDFINLLQLIPREEEEGLVI